MQNTNLYMKIDINKISDTWKKISSETNSPGKYSRNIFIDCKILIRASVINQTNTRCVEFIFDKNILNKKKISFKETKGIKVDVEKEDNYEDKLILCIYLKSSAFIDTYLKLLEKIITAIYTIENHESSLHKIITYLSSWRKCFEDEHYDGLSKEEQIGLYGELSFIKEIYSKQISPEKIINYWHGPEGGLHDFKFSDYLVEIKTFSKNKNKIRISNVDQLNYKFFTNLYLGCVEIENNNSGLTLVNLIDDLKNSIFKENHIQEQFNEKLSLYGYLEIHKDNYTNKFLVSNINYYKVKEGFPSILKKDLVEGITDIYYAIELTNCEKFKCSGDFIS